MTFDPTLNPNIRVDGQSTTPNIRADGQPVDRHLDSLYDTLAHGLPRAIDDLHNAASAAGILYGAGAADAFGRIIGRLGVEVAEARADIAYLRRAVDERHAATLTELDRLGRELAEVRDLLRDARTQRSQATADAVQRRVALETIRREITDAATYAKTAAAERRDWMDWFTLVGNVVNLIDATIGAPVAGAPAVAHAGIPAGSVVIIGVDGAVDPDDGSDPVAHDGDR